VKPHRNSFITYNVVFGSMELSSPYLWKAGESSKPLVEMGITHNGRSWTVSRALTDFGIEDSFARAAKRFEEHYGFRLGTSTVDRVTKASALRAEAYVEEKLREEKERCEQTSEPQILGEPMLVELDGCEIRTGVFVPVEKAPEDEKPARKKIIGWRDVGVGLARPMSWESKLYVAQMEQYPKVVSQLFCVATMLGMREETDVVAVADGGHGLREGLESQFPDMQFILDKPHLKKHLFETAVALGFTEEEQRKWVHSKLETISQGHVQEILSELEAQNAAEPNDRLRRFISYLHRFEDAVDYDRFKALGYPIGSGEIESAHKTVPQKRLKLPGATWRPDSINPMLALRVLRANEWWDGYCTGRVSATNMAA
jgi:hypothetical protein